MARSMLYLVGESVAELQQEHRQPVELRAEAQKRHVLAGTRQIHAHRLQQVVLEARKAPAQAFVRALIDAADHHGVDCLGRVGVDVLVAMAEATAGRDEADDLAPAVGQHLAKPRRAAQHRVDAFDVAAFMKDHLAGLDGPALRLPLHIGDLVVAQDRAGRDVANGTGRAGSVRTNPAVERVGGIRTDVELAPHVSQHFQVPLQVRDRWRCAELPILASCSIPPPRVPAAVGRAEVRACLTR